MLEEPIDLRLEIVGSPLVDRHGIRPFDLPHLLLRCATIDVVDLHGVLSDVLLF